MVNAPFLSRLAAAAATALRPSRARSHGSSYPRRAALRAARDRIVSRRRFEDALWRRAARRATHCLLHIGIDGMGEINATHGYETGNEVLEKALRQLCAAEGLAALCRVAGDEYVLCLDLPPADAERVAATIIDRLLAAEVDGQLLPIGVSIGLAACPPDGGGPELMRYAALAMHAAKQQGGAVLVAFDPKAHSQQQAQLAMARELRQAIAKGELRLVYQPKIDAVSLQVTAVEALLRWDHPCLGSVSPAAFIPVAERFGLIDAIGDWAMEQALAQAVQWRDAGLHMRVAINVSALQMRSEAFAARLAALLARHALPPACFTCEITESAAGEDTVMARRAFSRLRQVGVQVSVDDFGTGHSTLSSLRHLPVRELKLDRSFVQEVVESSEALALVNAVVEMAHKLGLRVVAEGIETPSQRDLLVLAGCDELQGFLFAKPMSARAITVWAYDHGFTASPAFKCSLFGEPSPANPKVAAPSANPFPAAQASPPWSGGATGAHHAAGP